MIATIDKISQTVTREYLDEEGQLLVDKIQDLLVEVVSGKHIFKSDRQIYACRSPTEEEQDNARIIFTRKVAAVTEYGLMTRVQIQQFAIDQNLIVREQIVERENVEKMIRRNMTARQHSRDSEQKLELDAEIIRLQTELLKLTAADEEIYGHSAESFAESARNDFLIARCTMSGELLDEPLWKDWSAYQKCNDVLLITDSRRAMIRIMSGLPIPVVRALARNDEWRMRWKGSKESHTPLFAGNSGSWDKNKISLVFWSDFYDSIYAHPDCPDEYIINDDSMLQDWINEQNRKVKQVRSKQNSAGKGQSIPTFRDGQGRRRKMTRVGTQNISVNTPYKVRT